MAWVSEKNTFNSRKSALDSLTTDSAIDTIATQINRSIKQYASTAGISPDIYQNRAQTDVNTYLGRLVDYDKNYETLINDLTITVKNLSSRSDINSKIKESGDLRENIAKLKKSISDATNDQDVSKNRKESVEDTDLNVSWYQGFASRVGFTKPLNAISVPILIGFGVFLLIMSGLMLKELFQVPGQVNQVYESESLFSLFSDSRLYSVIGALFLVIVVLGILSYRGYFGKSLN